MKLMNLASLPFQLEPIKLSLLPPEPGTPPSQEQINTLTILMNVTMWSFSISGVYRLAHCGYILWKARKNKVQEWYTYWMPVSICSYTLIAYVFVLYLYNLRHGKEWPDLAIKALFASLFGIGCFHRWLQTFQYLTVCLSLPHVFRSISIDRYLQQGNQTDEYSSARGSDSGPFDFESYMKAIKEQKRRKEKQECSLRVANVIMLSTIALCTVAGLVNVFVPLIVFLVIIFTTVITCVVLLCLINKQLKAITGMLPNQRNVTFLMVNMFLIIIQWFILAFASMKLLLMWEAGRKDVFEWRTFDDAYVAYYIIIFMLTFNLVNVLCCVNTFYCNANISDFIESYTNVSEQNEERRSSLQSSKGSAFYFQQTNKLQESIKQTIDEKEKERKEMILKEQMNNFFQAVLKEVNEHSNPQCQHFGSKFVREPSFIEQGEELDLSASGFLDDYGAEEPRESFDRERSDSIKVHDIFNKYVQELVQEDSRYENLRQNQSVWSPSVNQKEK